MRVSARTWLSPSGPCTEGSVGTPKGAAGAAAQILHTLLLLVPPRGAGSARCPTTVWARSEAWCSPRPPPPSTASPSGSTRSEQGQDRRAARILQPSRRAAWLCHREPAWQCPEHPAPPAAAAGERLGWCWKHGCAPGSVVGTGQAGGSQLLPLEPCVLWALSCSPSPQPLTRARLCPAGESELLALSAKGRLMTCDLCSPEDADVELTPAEIGRRIKELLSGIGNTSERYGAGLCPPADASRAPPWAPRWVFGHRLLALGLLTASPAETAPTFTSPWALSAGGWLGKPPASGECEQFGRALPAALVALGAGSSALPRAGWCLQPRRQKVGEAGCQRPRRPAAPAKPAVAGRADVCLRPLRPSVRGEEAQTRPPPSLQGDSRSSERDLSPAARCPDASHRWGAAARGLVLGSHRPQPHIGGCCGCLGVAQPPSLSPSQPRRFVPAEFPS